MGLRTKAEREVIQSPLVSQLGVLHSFLHGAVHLRQACTVVCPYGRLQSVLLDRNSIIVAYDYQRGEPRAKFRTTEATVFMACFGLGTLPLLAATQYLGRTTAPDIRSQLRRALPIVTVTVALLLILRGLNLGIPFISPHLAATPGHSISCH